MLVLFREPAESDEVAGAYLGRFSKTVRKGSSDCRRGCAEFADSCGENGRMD